MNQRRALARAAVGRGAMQNGVARQRIAAIAFLHVQARIIRDELGDVSAGRLKLHGHGNGPAVVLDQEQQRQCRRQAVLSAS